MGLQSIQGHLAAEFAKKIKSGNFYPKKLGLKVISKCGEFIFKRKVGCLQDNYSTIMQDTVEEQNAKNARFFRLYNSVQERLFCYLLSIVHNRVDAEDILQETATVLWQKFDQFEEGTSFGAWATRIARNKAFEFMRKNKKTRVFFDENFYDAVSQYAQESSRNISDRSDALRFCLKKVPEKSRKLLTMRFQKDLSIKRISQSTGRSANGLYQSFSRILNAMRICMDKYLARQAL